MCNLCDPRSFYSVQIARGSHGRMIRRVQERSTGRFVKVAQLETPKPVAVMEGNLAYEMAHPGKRSHTPMVKLCRACTERALGRPLRESEVPRV